MQLQNHHKTYGKKAAGLKDGQQWGAGGRGRGTDGDGEHRREEPDRKPEFNHLRPWGHA